MSNIELETNGAVAAHREKIIQKINFIENVVFLDFMDKLLDAFKRKQGI